MNFVRGYKKHYNFVECNSVKELLSSGFILDKVNAYQGITGIYREFIFDIYFDWIQYTERYLSGVVVFKVYFMPKKNQHDLSFLLERLNKDYLGSRISEIQWDKTKCSNGVATYCLGIRNFGSFPDVVRIKKRMDFLIDVLNKDNAKSISYTQLSALRIENQELRPQIYLYRSND